jgi:hypothetical protein
LERRDGKYLQTSFNYYGRRVVTDALAAMRIEPIGFDTEPPKHGYDYYKEFEQTFGPCRR